ncbi:CBS domain-containing protein [Gemmatimonadota bacterium]
MKIRNLLETKGNVVVTVPPSLPVNDAVRLLVEHNIGSVVVVRDGDIEGILTERDILRLVAKDSGGLERLKVDEVMTRDVIVGVPGDSLEYVMEIMIQNRFRHLPVVDDGGLQGILSIGDVVGALRKNVQAENRYMRDYIQGKTY